MPRNRVLALLVALALSLPVVAAEKDTLLDWGNGPAKWIMTREEERAWKAVKTEDAAREFIYLFWARRDPTPGTYANEFRSDFEGRVSYADRNFKEPDRRGALSERGRVLLALGMPTSLGSEAAKQEKQFVTGNRSDVTGGRQLAGRTVWTWSREESIQKFGLPLVEVVFIHDRNKGGARIDPQRTGFVNALPGALKRMIVSPELTVAPEWSKPHLVARESGASGQMIIEGEKTTTTVTRTVLFPEEPVAAKPAGAGKLTLVRDAFAIDTQTKNDPFASLQSVARFANGQELGFVSEICTGKISEELPTITMQATLSGMINGEKLNMRAPAEEVVPDSIKASAGCYLVRGAIPLAEMTAGTYTLAVVLSTSDGRTYNLSKDLQVE